MKDDDVNEKLWNYAMSEESFVVQEFALAVTGIGALFFAYGQITSSPLRLLISLIGLGASSIICMHALGASKDRKAVFDRLREKNDPVRLAHMMVTSWRGKGRYNIIYQSTLRLITYFTGLVAIAWLVIAYANISLLVYDKPVRYQEFEFPGILLLAVVIALVAYRKYEDYSNYSKKTKTASAK